MQTTQEKVQKDSSLKTRAKTALVIGAFLIVHLVLLIFSNWRWIPFVKGTPVRLILSFVCLLIVVVLVYFSSREIRNLFKLKKGLFIWTSIWMTIIVFLSSFLFLVLREPLWIPLEANAFGFAQLAIISAFLLTYLINQIIICILWKQNKIEKKSMLFWYPFLMSWLVLFFNAFYYVTTIHSWTVYIFLLAISMGSDIFGYALGSKFGKHKIAPKISPKKSWEGLISSYGLTILLGCGLIGIGFIGRLEHDYHSLFVLIGCQWSDKPLDILINLQPYYWGIYITFIIILITISIFGDFFFSYIKRKFNIKDFSNLLPGHGGLLDRLDALTFVFIIYYLFTIICQLSIPNASYGIKYLWE